MKLLERRSIRLYDKNVKINDDELKQIILEANLAPSSMNMQPWRYVIISSDEAKEKLRPGLYGNLRQLETSAAMIVIFNDLHKFELAEKIYNTAVEKGLMPEEVREKQLANIRNMVQKVDLNKLHVSGMIDCGLAAMNLMYVAREHGYDTCPIGGFNHEMIHEIVDLDKNRYSPVMIISIGKAAEEGYPSVRLPFDDVAKII
ncbi:MAG: nitroreductase family protein [Acholeplasmataceae bacterium]|jgi:nitroreductase